MTTLALRAAVVVLLMCSAGCESPTPTAPSAPPVLPPSVPSPAPNFPDPSGPSRSYVFDHESTYRVSDYTRQSRFALYDNGAFVLQFIGRGEYRGRYGQTGDSVTFDWEGVSAAGPWGATGTVAGSLLTIRYNGIMELSDFENAVYALAP